jgi:CheY-specific phosphatase CheX
MMEPNEVSVDPFIIVREHLIQSTIELFDAYGMPVQLTSLNPTFVPHPDEGRVVIAVMGYAGETFRGGIVLLTGKENVRTWDPGVDGEKDAVAAIHDTVGEFANMLLGRLKMAMLKMGTSFLLTTPTTASGADVRIPLPHGGLSAWQRFEGSPGGRIDVRLDATFDPSFRFNSRPSKEPPAAAGEMMLF